MREDTVERRLKTKIEALGGRCVKLSPIGAVGIPDRLVLTRGFIGLVELKRPKGGVVAPKQRRWSEWLTEMGIPYALLSTIEEVDTYVGQRR